MSALGTYGTVTLEEFELCLRTVSTHATGLGINKWRGPRKSSTVCSIIMLLQHDRHPWIKRWWGPALQHHQLLCSRCRRSTQSYELVRLGLIGLVSNSLGSRKRLSFSNEMIEWVTVQMRAWKNNYFSTFLAISRSIDLNRVDWFSREVG